MGLTSRAGVAPLYLSADIAGPMARTGRRGGGLPGHCGEDPDDPVTAVSRGRPREDYSAALRADGLRGARIGVLLQAYNTSTADPEVLQVFRAALDAMRRAGAVIVDSVRVDSLDAWRRIQSGGCNPFKHDINAWLALRRAGPRSKTWKR